MSSGFFTNGFGGLNNFGNPVNNLGNIWRLALVGQFPKGIWGLAEPRKELDWPKKLIPKNWGQKWPNPRNQAKEVEIGQA